MLFGHTEDETPQIDLIFSKKKIPELGNRIRGVFSGKGGGGARVAPTYFTPRQRTINCGLGHMAKSTVNSS